MKILYTPNLIAPSLTDDQRARILAAAGPGAHRGRQDAAKQREEIADTDMVFGRVSNDVFVMGKRIRYYPRSAPASTRSSPRSWWRAT